MRNRVLFWARVVLRLGAFALVIAAASSLVDPHVSPMDKTITAVLSGFLAALHWEIAEEMRLGR